MYLIMPLYATLSLVCNCRYLSSLLRVGLGLVGVKLVYACSTFVNKVTIDLMLASKGAKGDGRTATSLRIGW